MDLESAGGSLSESFFRAADSGDILPCAGAGSDQIGDRIHSCEKRCLDAEYRSGILKELIFNKKVTKKHFFNAGRNAVVLGECFVLSVFRECIKKSSIFSKKVLVI